MYLGCMAGAWVSPMTKTLMLNMGLGIKFLFGFVVKFFKKFDPKVFV